MIASLMLVKLGRTVLALDGVVERRPEFKPWLVQVHAMIDGMTQRLIVLRDTGKTATALYQQGRAHTRNVTLTGRDSRSLIIVERQVRDDSP